MTPRLVAAGRGPGGMQQVIRFTALQQERGSIVQQQFNTQVFRPAALLPFIPLGTAETRAALSGGMKFPEKRVRVHTIRRPVFEPALELPGSNPEGISSARGPIEKNTDNATTMTRVRFIQVPGRQPRGRIDIAGLIPRAAPA